MFIVCPSCSGPYRIPAEQIAPLVQTACPHCEYRIILDFEAANEPSLREAGQQFAQGFESVEAYASVYDHVTSKPDAQPRLGVTSVTVQSDARPQQVAAAGGGTQPARPLQPRAEPTPAPTPVAAITPTPAPAEQPAAGSAGNRHKTVIQVPSKKPVSMDAGPTSAAVTPSSTAAASAAGPSMRAGKGVDVVDPVEARDSDPAVERKPPHTPPVASVVSSGPAPSEQPTPPPEDIAAQSGPHPNKTETKPAEVKPAEIKPADKPAPQPAGSSTIYIIVVALVVAGIVAVILLNR